MRKNHLNKGRILEDEDWIVEDVYSDEGAESLLEDDEINEFEAAFMHGYNS